MSKEIPKNLKPRSLWLVIHECRYDVIAISPQGDGFFAPGQEHWWGLGCIQEWIREIPQVRYMEWNEASQEFKDWIEKIKCITRFVYDTFTVDTKIFLEEEFEKYLLDNVKSS